MPLIGINPSRGRQEPLSKLEQIALGLDIAQKVLGTTLAIPEYIQKRDLTKKQGAVADLQAKKTTQEIEASDLAARIQTEKRDPTSKRSKGLRDFAETTMNIDLPEDMSAEEIEERFPIMKEQFQTAKTKERETSKQEWEEKQKKLDRALQIKLKEMELQNSPNRGANLFDKNRVEAVAKRYEDLPTLEGRVRSIDRALTILPKVETGPFVGSRPVAALRRIGPGGAELQQLETLLNTEGLETVKATSKEAGARSIDTERERAYMERVTPGIDKHESVIESILLTSKSLLEQSRIETNAQKDHIERYGDLRGYQSPLEGKRTYYNPETRQIVFRDEKEGPPSGFMLLSDRLSGESEKIINGHKYRKTSGGWELVEEK